MDPEPWLDLIILLRKDTLCTLPNVPWIMRFSILADGSKLYSHPVWVSSIVTSNSFRWFFYQPWVVSSCPWTSQYSAEYLGAALCRSQDSSVWLSPPWCPVLWILATFISPNCQLSLLNSGSLPGSAWLSPPCNTAWILSQRRMQAVRGPTTFFSSLKENCHFLAVSTILKMLYIYIYTHTHTHTHTH